MKNVYKLLLVSTTMLYSHLATAEILVILPETGALASATESIKRGIVQANSQANGKYHFKFVNSQQQSIPTLLNKHITKSTELVIGPLDKAAIESIANHKYKVPILSLNTIGRSTDNLYQFALSKQEDAQALSQIMKKRGVEKVWVLREPSAHKQTESFYQEMKKIWGNDLQDKSKLPFISRKSQGVLLLGSNDWLKTQKLPKANIYTLPSAIEENTPPPEGIIFCDTPALYNKQWTDVNIAYQLKPVSMPFQRLIAFGGDAWQIADALKTRKNNQNIQFVGRTGTISITAKHIQRMPQCFEYHYKKIKFL